jgi:hypothetical protein
MQRQLYLLLCLFILTASPGKAQKMLIGPKAGANLSWVNFVDEEYSEAYQSLPILGYDFGLAMNFPVTKQFSLHTEVNLVNRGKNLKRRTDSTYYHKAHYRHIEIPAMIRYSFGNEHFRWYINAGPNLSYWMGGKGKIQMEEMDELAYQKQSYQVIFGEYDYRESDFTMFLTEVNRFQINLNFGAGMMMELLNGHFVMFDLRYRWGQTHMGEATSGNFWGLHDYRDNLKSNSNGATFSVAYLAVLDFAKMLKGKSSIRVKRWRN